MPNASCSLPLTPPCASVTAEAPLTSSCATRRFGCVEYPLSHDALPETGRHATVSGQARNLATFRETNPTPGGLLFEQLPAHTEGHMDTCSRCSGLMLADYFQADEAYTPVRMWRCMNCGDVVDPQILAARRAVRTPPAPVTVLASSPLPSLKELLAAD